MLKIYGFFLASSLVVLFSGAASAEDNALLALNRPVRHSVNYISSGLQAQATAQIGAAVPGYTDFDVFSSVNDPLYREGSRKLLKQVMAGDAGEKGARGEALRDAPISKETRPGAARPAKARSSLKRSRAGRPLHADPVKVKNTF